MAWGSAPLCRWGSHKAPPLSLHPFVQLPRLWGNGWVKLLCTFNIKMASHWVSVRPPTC